MNTTLLFFVPPAAGAVIGFVTNVVAIRMLFRPLKEIRVFGVRLPFTPGILPKGRHKLALSIGEMVERELLTPEILRARLLRDDTGENIRNAVSIFTANVIGKNPRELFDGSHDDLSLKISAAAEKLYPFFVSAFLEFIRRNETRRELESKGRILLRNIFLKLNVFQRLFLSAGQYDQNLEEKMPEIIDDFINGAEETLKEARIKKTLTGTVSSMFGGFFDGEIKNLKMLLEISEEEKKRLDDFLFEKLMTEADNQIENILASLDIKTIVSDRIDSLDMLRVERIIMDIMADQFKWIDIFGGILGFFIGLFQSVFNLFLR